jgi:hypothetical protein
MRRIGYFLREQDTCSLGWMKPHDPQRHGLLKWAFEPRGAASKWWRFDEIGMSGLCGAKVCPAALALAWLLSMNDMGGQSHGLVKPALLLERVSLAICGCLSLAGEQAISVNLFAVQRAAHPVDNAVRVLRYALAQD